MAEPQRTYVTQEFLEKMKEELTQLKTRKRAEVAQRLKEAIAMGDLSENSEYDDAKNEQAFIEGEILTLESQIRNSEIIKADDTNKGVVHLGNTVVIKDMEYDEDETYTIVGSTEADTTEGKISNESPVGMAILGKTVGTVVQVKVPAGVLEYKILEIKK